MQCPFCGADSQVSDSRATGDGQVRRRRVCNQCRRRFTTYERVGSPSLRVIKRDSKTEPFSSEKLLACLQRVGRRRIDDEQVIRLARDIEAALVDSNRKKITSWEIADLVLERLAALDPLCRDRLAVNYLDEDGQLRTRPRDMGDELVEQLGLFAGDEETLE